MKKSRFTEEQIIGFLRQAEAGMPIKELRRRRQAEAFKRQNAKQLKDIVTH